MKPIEITKSGLMQKNDGRLRTLLHDALDTLNEDLAVENEELQNSELPPALRAQYDEWVKLHEGEKSEFLITQEPDPRTVYNSWNAQLKKDWDKLSRIKKMWAMSHSDLINKVLELEEKLNEQRISDKGQ